MSNLQIVQGGLKVSELDEVTSLNDNDQFNLTQNGQTVRISKSNLESEVGGASFAVAPFSGTVTELPMSATEGDRVVLLPESKLYEYSSGSWSIVNSPLGSISMDINTGSIWNTINSPFSVSFAPAGALPTQSDGTTGTIGDPNHSFGPLEINVGQPNSRVVYFTGNDDFSGNDFTKLLIANLGAQTHTLITINGSSVLIPQGIYDDASNSILYVFYRNDGGTSEQYHMYSVDYSTNVDNPTLTLEYSDFGTDFGNNGPSTNLEQVMVKWNNFLVFTWDNALNRTSLIFFDTTDGSVYLHDIQDTVSFNGLIAAGVSSSNNLYFIESSTKIIYEVTGDPTTGTGFDRGMTLTSRGTDSRIANRSIAQVSNSLALLEADSNGSDGILKFDFNTLTGEFIQYPFQGIGISGSQAFSSDRLIDGNVVISSSTNPLDIRGSIFNLGNNSFTFINSRETYAEYISARQNLYGAISGNRALFCSLIDFTNFEDRTGNILVSAPQTVNWVRQQIGI